MEDGKAFKLPLDYFSYHFAFYGVTGTGKTRAAMNLAVKAEKEGLNLRVIDVEGEWKGIIPKLGKETVYYDVSKNIHINPFELEDPGLTKLLLKETIFKGIELEYRDLSPQMNFLLDKCIQISGSIPKLIENIISHNPETHFPLRNLDLTRTALLTRLNPYKDNPVLRQIFYVSKSNIDMKEIENKNVIFDLHKLDMKVAYKEEMRLLYNTLAVAYLREALCRNETNTIKNLFIADEAQLLVPKIFKKAISTDTWATTDFATRLRKRGESLAIISQSPANIEDDIRKNSQNLFVFRLLDPWDVKAIAGMFGYVHTDEVNYLSSMLTSLEARTAIVKTPLTPYPFTTKTLDVNLEQVSEKEMEKYSVETENNNCIALNEDETELLENVRKRPFLNNTERALSLGWHRSRYSKTRKSLLRHGIAEEVTFKTKLRGAPSHFLKLKEMKGYGRGQFIHGFWVNKIVNYLREQSCDPKTEFKVGDKIVDIAYTMNGKEVFVEVEYKSDWKGNMLRASKLCNRLVSVFIREKDIVDALAFVKNSSLSNVTVTDAYYCYKVLP
jgi:DNA helicase HerA-like ATPase